MPERRKFVLDRFNDCTNFRWTADREALDEILFHRITDARLIALRDLALRRNFHRGIDDVFAPVSLTRGDITR